MSVPDIFTTNLLKLTQIKGFSFNLISYKTKIIINAFQSFIIQNLIKIFSINTKDV